MRYLEHFGIFRKFRDILKCLVLFLKLYDSDLFGGQIASSAVSCFNNISHNSPF